MIKVTGLNNISSSEILYKLACVANICYSKKDIPQTLEELKKNEEAQIRIVSNILKNGHESILEHVSLTFGIEGISRNCTHQIVRHRHMSFAQQSFHYTIADNIDIPLIYSNNSDTARIILHAKDLISEIHTVYKKLIDSGIRREEARHILPSGQLTRIWVTANVRQWKQFLFWRTCNRNCEEIKAVALIIQDKILELMPYLNIGPSCVVNGICKETKSCGRIKQL